MTSMVNSDAKSERHYEIIDPLGEIRRRAKELWTRAGAPPDRTWENFFEQAEQDLLGDRGDEEAAQRTRRARRAPHSAPEPEPEIQQHINQQDNQLLSIVASAFPRFLDAHEAACLAYVLSTNTIRLRDGNQLANIGVEPIADVLTIMCSEYDRDFLKEQGVMDGRTAASAARRAYWVTKLGALRHSDQPLSYADRNTISRVRVALAAESRVLQLEFRGE